MEQDPETAYLRNPKLRLVYAFSFFPAVVTGFENKVAFQDFENMLAEIFLIHSSNLADEALVDETGAKNF